MGCFMRCFIGWFHGRGHWTGWPGGQGLHDNNLPRIWGELAAFLFPSLMLSMSTKCFTRKNSLQQNNNDNNDKGHWSDRNVTLEYDLIVKLTQELHFPVWVSGLWWEEGCGWEVGWVWGVRKWLMKEVSNQILTSCQLHWVTWSGQVWERMWCGLSWICALSVQLQYVTCLGCVLWVTQSQIIWCTVHGVQYKVYSTKCTVQGVQYKVYSTSIRQFVRKKVDLGKQCSGNNTAWLMH